MFSIVLWLGPPYLAAADPSLPCFGMAVAEIPRWLDCSPDCVYFCAYFFLHTREGVYPGCLQVIDIENPKSGVSRPLAIRIRLLTNI